MLAPYLLHPCNDFHKTLVKCSPKYDSAEGDISVLQKSFFLVIKIYAVSKFTYYFREYIIFTTWIEEVIHL